MYFPEEYEIVTVLDPGAPSFVTVPIQYLGPKDVANGIKHMGIVEPSKLIFKGTREIVFRYWEYTHNNIWGSPYQVRARELHVRCEYYKLNHDYARAVQFTAQDLCLLNEHTGQWGRLGADSCWGNKGVLVDTEEGEVQNVLLFIDKHFRRLFEVKGDMADPQELCFQMFFNEIFADG